LLEKRDDRQEGRGSCGAPAFLLVQLDLQKVVRVRNGARGCPVIISDRRGCALSTCIGKIELTPDPSSLGT